jgi:CheY-like chemotaxis protein
MSLRQSLTSRGARAAAVGCFSAALAALGSLATLAVRDAWAVPLLLVVALSCATLFAAAIAGFRDRQRGADEEQRALSHAREPSSPPKASAPLRIRAPSPPPTSLRTRRTSALPLARRLLLARSQQMDAEEGAVEGFISLSPRATDARANIATPASRSPRTPQVAYSSQSAPTPQLDPPASAVAGLHVLIVDDQQTHRRIAGRMLERLGCTHEDVDDGDAVVKALASSDIRVDAVLLDIVMARTNGLDVVRSLRAQGLELAVVACTAHFDEATQASEFESAGFDGVVKKPISQRALELALAKAMGAHARAASHPEDDPNALASRASTIASVSSSD